MEAFQSNPVGAPYDLKFQKIYEHLANAEAENDDANTDDTKSEETKPEVEKEPETTPEEDKEIKMEADGKVTETKSTNINYWYVGIAIILIVVLFLLYFYTTSSRKVMPRMPVVPTAARGTRVSPNYYNSPQMGGAFEFSLDSIMSSSSEYGINTLKNLKNLRN